MSDTKGSGDSSRPSEIQDEHKHRQSRILKSRLQTKITSRDLDILEFLIEMKFSNLSQLHRKFFSELKTGEQSRSELWAQERMRALRKLGLVELKPVYLNHSFFYQATVKGYEILQSLRTEKTFLLPPSAIDHRFFEHDRLVVDVRIALEKKSRAFNWTSERALKSESATLQNGFGLQAKYLPDAVYLNRNNERIAFELELSPKARFRYKDKIQKYIEAISFHQESEKRLRAVLFVAKAESVLQTLTDLTSSRPDLFKVERLSSLMGLTDQASSSKQSKLSIEPNRSGLGRETNG